MLFRSKEHNFDAIPTVAHLDEFFHRKYEEDPATHTMRQVATAEQVLADLEARGDAHIHMPSPSYWPIVVALALPTIATGLIYSHLVAVVGGVVLLFGIYGWALEPSTAPDSDMDPPAQGGVPAVAHG